MNANGKSSPEAPLDDDVKVLHSLGYAQELSRRLSRFSNFAISFSIICILSGGVNSLAQATSGAGGASIGLGWPLGVLISGFFGLAMAQIASAFPTAGGLYHWGSILGNRFTGWLTAWFNLLGLVTVLGSINVGAYNFFIGAFGPALHLADSMRTLVWFLAGLTILQALINAYGISVTAKLTDFSGYLIFGTSVLMALVCLTHTRSFDLTRLWTFANYSGQAGAGVWPRVSSAGWVFVLGLLLPLYTVTGYDASAHTSEETKQARLAVPRAILSSILWSGAFGYFFLAAFVLMIPDMHEAAKQGWNVFFWAMEQRVPLATRDLLYALIFTAQMLCGLATVTSASRMIYAFARDGGLPASRSLARVSARHRTPGAAIWAAAILSLLFVSGAKWFETGGTPVYTVVVSCTVIFLYFSCALPIALGLFAYGGPKWRHMGPWSLGRGGFSVFAVLSIVAMALIFVVGVQPPNELALNVTIGFLSVTAIVWLAFERRRFKGPPVGRMIAARQAEIAAAEAALGPPPD
ncbi:MAG TPA: amino acid permease [Steroidobacteraceae bacterium]|nr:amino acid permease [Steroidobacteraceae bacterium]